MNFHLNPEQQKLFNKLKAAYKACEKAGILFVNDYGRLEAYDKAIISDFTDGGLSTSNVRAAIKSHGEAGISSHDAYCSATMKIPESWADDEHLITLTPAGVRLRRAQDSHDDDL